MDSFYRRRGSRWPRWPRRPSSSRVVVHQRAPGARAIGRQHQRLQHRRGELPEHAIGQHGADPASAGRGRRGRAATDVSASSPPPGSPPPSELPSDPAASQAGQRETPLKPQLLLLSKHLQEMRNSQWQRGKWLKLHPLHTLQVQVFMLFFPLLLTSHQVKLGVNLC